MKNIFANATIKLTLVYTLILAIICIGFSAAFYSAAHSQLSRPISFRLENSQQTQPLFDGSSLPSTNGSYDVVIRQRDNQTRAFLLSFLVIVNTILLIIGALASYFLARWTLKPIQKMTEQQANFISDASHELRTPLTAISMENEVALRDPDLTKAELTEVIQSNLEETRRLQSLTDRLLKLSQKEPLELENINIKDSVESAIKRHSTGAKNKNITIKNLAKSHLVSSNFDALTDIITIFVENAIKYSPEKSTITVGFKNNKLYVSDEGSGISEEDLPYIFDRFYRAEKSRTSKGYGLGLSLAKQLSEQLDLAIGVENNPKKGATFFIEHFSKPSA